MQSSATVTPTRAAQTQKQVELARPKPGGPQPGLRIAQFSTRGRNRTPMVPVTAQTATMLDHNEPAISLCTVTSLNVSPVSPLAAEAGHWYAAPHQFTIAKSCDVWLC